MRNISQTLYTSTNPIVDSVFHPGLYRTSQNDRNSVSLTPTDNGVLHALRYHYHTSQAVQLADYLSDILLPGRYQTNEYDRTSGSLTPINATTHQDQARGSSASTRRRHAHARDDYYTDVCGVISPEKATPVRKDNLGNGEFSCPRCGSSFTRPKSVKDHFPSCISRYGNPKPKIFQHRQELPLLPYLYKNTPRTALWNSSKMAMAMTKTAPRQEKHDDHRVCCQPSRQQTIRRMFQSQIC